ASLRAPEAHPRGLRAARARHPRGVPSAFAGAPEGARLRRFPRQTIRPPAGMGEAFVRVVSLVALSIACASARAALDEVPFVVSPDTVTNAMLQLAKVGNEDYVIDLGSGDGRIVILAAKRFGARGLGIEIREDLVEKSREN